MKAWPVVVFVEGRFSCVTLHASKDAAEAWHDGACYSARLYGGDRFTAFLASPSLHAGHRLEEMKRLLDEYDSTILLPEAKRAIDALVRSEAIPAPTDPSSPMIVSPQ